MSKTKLKIPSDFNVMPVDHISTSSRGYGSQLMNIQHAHNHGVTGEGVKIGIGDTGVNFEHPNLPNVKDTFTAFDDDIDRLGHGSHVTGIVFSIAPSSEYVAGKLISKTEGGDFNDLASFIYYCVDQGVDIIVFSIGAEGVDSVKKVDEAIEFAYKNGVLIVAATGNSGNSKIDYPAIHPRVLSVGAIDQNKIPASFMNKGIDLDFVAPGMRIFSAWLGTENRYADGTSQAAPHVAGLAALIISDYKSKYNGAKPSVDELVHILKYNTEDLSNEGHDINTGYGLPKAKGGELGAFLYEGEIVEKKECTHVELEWYQHLFASITKLLKI